MSAILGKIPTMEEYLGFMNEIDPLSKDIYRYLNFNELPSYIEQANSAKIPTINVVT